MTDQINAATSGAPDNGAAPAADGPIAPWPGELVLLENGVQVFVRSTPDVAGAEPAVFVHGLGGSATNWTDLMGMLSEPRGDWPGPLRSSRSSRSATTGRFTSSATPSAAPSVPGSRRVGLIWSRR
jgi:pimeloyl-ACP methyl ester carboxylesterase